MACKKKICKYYRNCIVRSENDGSGCGDFERATGEMPASMIKTQYDYTIHLAKKKGYRDDEVYAAMKFARLHLKYSEMMWAETYVFKVSNKQIIEYLEKMLNEKDLSLY